MKPGLSMEGPIGDDDPPPELPETMFVFVDNLLALLEQAGIQLPIEVKDWLHDTADRVHRTYMENREEAIKVVREGLLRQISKLESEKAEIRTTWLEAARYYEDQIGAERLKQRFDDITGALRRQVYFEEILPLQLKLACVRHEPRWPTLAIFDVGEMKAHNDESGYGHAFGTALLRAIGTTVRGAIRHPELPEGADVFARTTDGDEFDLVFPDPPTIHDAYEVASRPRDFVANRKDWSEFHPGLSEPLWRPRIDLGAVAVDSVSLREAYLSYRTPEERTMFIKELIRQWRDMADQAMYHAKRGRLNHIVFRLARWVNGVLVEIQEPISWLNQE